MTTQGWKTENGSNFIVRDANGKVVIANGVVEPPKRRTIASASCHQTCVSFATMPRVSS